MSDSAVQDLLSSRKLSHMAGAAEPGTVGKSVQATVLSLVTSSEALWRLEERWRRLEESGAAAHSVFQSFDWVMGWARHYAGPDSEPFVVTGYRGDELVFVWPLMRQRVGPFRILRWISEPLSQFGDVLCGAGERAELWVAEALAFIRRLRGVDALWLRHVRADARARPFLASHFREARHVDAAPWLDLGAFATPEHYEERFTPAQRKRRKKLRKALEDDFGPLSFTILQQGGQADQAIDQAIAEKCAWLDERGRHNFVLSDARARAFLKDLSRRGGGALQLIVSRLAAGEQAVSWEIGLRFVGRHFAFVTSHRNVLTDYSPGRLHMGLSQKQAAVDGLAAFDLMVPNDAYKASWSSAAVETRDYYLPLSMAGYAFGTVYLERLRPLLRKIYVRLPAGVLSRLQPLFRRRSV